MDTKKTCISCIHINETSNQEICDNYNIIEGYNLKKCPKYEHFALEEYYDLLTETVQQNTIVGGRRNVS